MNPLERARHTITAPEERRVGRSGGGHWTFRGKKNLGGLLPKVVHEGK